MRQLLLACLLVPLSAAALAEAQGETVVAGDGAKRPQLSSQQCGVATDYNVLVDGGGVWLYREEGLPKEVFFHDGRLSVDREVQEVNAADAQRLRELEAASHRLMPQVAGVAREAVDITFDSLAGVVEVITGSKRKARGLNRFRKDTLQHVERTLGTGRWDQDVFGEEFENRIEAAAESMAASFGRSVLWQVFTGRASRMEARAERLEAELEESLKPRIAAIEARAEAMCAEAETLHALAQALEYRYRGEPLELIRVSRTATEEGVAHSAVRAGGRAVEARADMAH